jgi:hypothetical protein
MLASKHYIVTMQTDTAPFYFILDGQNGQPFPALRVRLVTGDPAVDTVVAVMTADLRSAGVETIVRSSNLTPECPPLVTFMHATATSAVVA